MEAGRAGEPAAYSLSGSLKRLGFELGRLKTGTSATLNRRSIDFSKMDQQPGDEPTPFFSYRTPRAFTWNNCRATSRTQPRKLVNVIRQNLHRFGNVFRSDSRRRTPVLSIHRR